MQRNTSLFRHPQFQILFLIFSLLLVWLPWCPFPYKMPLLVCIISLVIFTEYGTLELIGFHEKPILPTILWGSGLCVGVLLIGEYFKPILEEIFDQPTDYSSYGQLKGNFPLVSELWGKAMVSAAFGEEIFYRGFLFFILSKLIGDKPFSKVLIVILTAILFGAVHNNQGIVGMINITLIGALFGVVYYLSKKNLWATILAHAMVDTIGLYCLYHGIM